MGSGRKDRLHLRRIEWLACLIGFAVCAAMTPGSLVGEPSRLLTTFLGLVAASILPTISLIVGGMVTGGRSVKSLGELGAELEQTISVLFAIFGLIALAMLVLMTLAIPMPFGALVPNSLRPVPAIIGQGFVGFIGVLVVCKSGTVPGAIRRALSLRTDIALDEARRKTVERAGDAAAKTGFQTKSGFGRITNLDDLKSKDDKSA